ncbi:hypothetical protein [Streptomyces formicae]|uniref:hypothetical protein n=1 Tax=Streptomyces formicae TaxID=1616117 RepID=UPI001F2CEEB8|nr:hypothetical protein [Streptomyces formicae]
MTLSCPEWPERGFFTSLLRKDHLTKRIEIDRRTDYAWTRVADHTFTGWSEIPSPLPPFRYSHLWTTTAVGPGTCLVMPDSRGLLITGANYVGKTSTSLVLCQRGGRLVSDSLAVLDLTTGLFRRYDGPLGFRRGSRRHHLDKITSGVHRETVSPDTGLVLLVPPAEFLGAPNLPQGKVDRIVRLERHASPPAPYTAETDLSPWFSGAHRHEIAQHLPEATTVVPVTEAASPLQIADLLESVL